MEKLRPAMEMLRPSEPFNLSQEVGKGFLVGSVFGVPYVFARGGIQALWVLAPIASCYSAVWWGTSSAIQHARRKEDTPVLTNALAIAGANGIASLPMGFRFAGRFALIGGAVGAVVVGGLTLLRGDQCHRNLWPRQADR